MAVFLASCRIRIRVLAHSACTFRFIGDAHHGSSTLKRLWISLSDGRKDLTLIFFERVKHLAELIDI